MKQLALAVVMYAGDYDDTYSPTCVDYGGHRSSSQSFWQELLQPYVRNWSILVCPSNPRDTRISRLTGQPIPAFWSGAYAMNQNFGYRDTAGISMASLEYPASIIVITECVDMYTTRPVWFDRPTPIYDLAARHNGGLNNAFADGHAKWLGYDEAKRYEYWYFEGGAYSWGG